jgi:beta-lactamase class A
LLLSFQNTKSIQMKKTVFIFTLLSLITCSGFSQKSVLHDKINQILKSKRALVGVGILDFESGDTLTFNGKGHFPMQSVYKFHLALAVLNQVDKGKLTLNQDIFVSKADMIPNLYSPMREKYPEGNLNLPLSEIIKYTVSQSDNVGCDRLFKLVGGTEKANKYIHSLGLKDVQILDPEARIQNDWSLQYRNYSTPYAAVQLLQKFYKEHILSKNSQDFLYKIMVETTTGPNKIKGLLPLEAIVAHKTGFSGKNKEGLIGATNDIGIITLPNGKQFAIAIFVSNSMEDEKTNDKIIAEIALAAWDYYLVD